MRHWRWFLLGAFAITADIYVNWGYEIPTGVWPFVLLMAHWAAQHRYKHEPDWDMDAELDGILGRG